MKVFPSSKTFVIVGLKVHAFRYHCLLLFLLVNGTGIYTMLCLWKKQEVQFGLYKKHNTDQKCDKKAQMEQ